MQPTTINFNLNGRTSILSNFTKRYRPGAFLSKNNEEYENMQLCVTSSCIYDNDYCLQTLTSN